MYGGIAALLGRQHPPFGHHAMYKYSNSIILVTKIVFKLCLQKLCGLQLVAGKGFTRIPWPCSLVVTMHALRSFEKLSLPFLLRQVSWDSCPPNRVTQLQVLYQPVGVAIGGGQAH